ncbi:MAG: glycosyltransferase family 4 protein [Candidatus Gracilibacteria bacterium]
MKNVYFYTGSQVHNIHKQEAKCAPEGFQYIASNPALFKTIGVHARSPKNLFGFLKKGFQNFIFHLLLALKLPKVHYIRPSTKVDLIHSTHHPLLNKKIPWVMDLEEVTQLTWYNRRVFDKKRNQRFFEKLFAGKACRGILCWSESAQKSILNGLDCSRFREKIQVVPLTLEAMKPVQRTFQKDRVNLLFLSTIFDTKGGMETLLATEELSKSYNVHLYMASNPPESIRKQFENHPNIHIGEPQSRGELIRMYKEADIFVMPGHFEAFGFVFLEAFSYGLPCVTTDGYAGEDLVEDGVRGKVIKNYFSIFDKNYISTLKSFDDRQKWAERCLYPPKDYVDRLAKAIEGLIVNPDLREKMSRNAYESVVSGKFSQAHRRKILKEIYTKALQSS